MKPYVLTVVLVFCLLMGLVACGTDASQTASPDGETDGTTVASDTTETGTATAIPTAPV